MDISLENHFSLDSKSQRVFLWGMPGVGKSTLGKRLATRIGFDFLDLDKLIEQQSGKSIASIFAEESEAEFRKKEETALIQCLDKSNVVIACGGGTPAFFSNAEKMLQAGIVIYLNASSAFIHSRLAQSPQDRPLVADEKDLKDYVEKTYAARIPFYKQAHIDFQIPSGDLNALAERLITRLTANK